VRSIAPICTTELDRERLVASVRGVGRARVVMFVILAGIIAGSSREMGWWPLLALLVAASLSIYLYRHPERRKRPEYWAAAGWLSTQVPLGIGIAITGGPRSPALSWLAIAIVSLVARFNRFAVRVGMAFLYVLLLVDTFGVDPGWTFSHPAIFWATAGLMFSVWVFAEALLRADLDLRSRDKVTGLPNQAKFLDDLNLALARAEGRQVAIAVLAVKLNGVELVHESLGPLASDRLLQLAGARLDQRLKRAELVARSSGDEFLILVRRRGVNGQEERKAVERAITAVAEEVQAAVNEQFEVEDVEVPVQATVGIALHTPGDRASDPARLAKTLLGDADFALATARSAGPGTIKIYEPPTTSPHRRLSMIGRLRRAIERGELDLHYQPTVDVDTGEIRGVEALARWDDPYLGMVPPSEFILLAEETGLIIALGELVAEKVVRQAREWDALGVHFEVAFNLSPRQLWQPERVHRLRSILSASGIPRSRFVIEITESAALRDFDRTAKLLSALRADGYQIAIDDFGVELSSLSRLVELPSDVLKIDRAFVAALESKPNADVMVKTIIQLADRLGIRSHAEGVETEDQRRFLRAHGCELAQGYLFSKPLPASQLHDQYIQSLLRRVLPSPAPGLRAA